MKDFLLDTETGDLAFENGDIKVGESDAQHQRLLLMTQKGSWKEFPTAGVGLASFLEDENPDGMIKEINQQFSGDGMTINKIAIEDGKLKVDADY